MPTSSKNSVQLVGSVLERTPGSTTSLPRLPAPKTGFPPVQHRTRSAFARSRDLSKQSTGNGERLDRPPAVTSETSRLPNVPPLSISNESNWREEVSRENEKILANMSPEERELERQAILERFGSGVGAILQRAKRNREMERGEEDSTAPEREIEQVPGSPCKCLICIRSCRNSEAPQPRDATVQQGQFSKVMSTFPTPVAESYGQHLNSQR
jgi:hypothetical protein